MENTLIPSYSTTRRNDICRRCGKKLKTIESIEVGMGPTCYKRYLSESNMMRLFEVKTHEQSTEKTSSEDETDP